MLLNACGLLDLLKYSKNLCDVVLKNDFTMMVQLQSSHWSKCRSTNPFGPVKMGMVIGERQSGHLLTELIRRNSFR